LAGLNPGTWDPDVLDAPADALSLFPSDGPGAARLALAMMLRTAHALPAAARAWWSGSGLSRGAAADAEAFFARSVAPALVRAELAAVARLAAAGKAQSPEDCGELRVRGSARARSITAEYRAGECSLEITLRLAAAHPLRLPEVECERRNGVKAAQWRRWALQVRRLLSASDGAVGSAADALDVWRRNLDREFAGVEPCPICYNVLHQLHRTLPNRTCATCGTQFHNHCLYKWFQSSQKSSCPLCRAAF
jgi:hypothetical protein